MNKKIFENARFTPKGDTEANWKKAVGFIPLDKEIIIYKPDENYSYARIKIGDGKTGINDLPFFADTEGLASKDWVAEQAESLVTETLEYVDNSIAAFPQADWNQNDSTAKDYIKNRPFYTEKGETEEIINGTYTTEDMGEGMYGGVCPYLIDEINPESLGTVNVQFDGKIYNNLTVTNFNDVFYAGNLSKMNTFIGTSFEDTEEPFLLALHVAECGFMFDLTKSTTHNLILSFSVDSVIKIEEKYLPDDILTKKTVDQVYNAESENAQSGVAVAEAIQPLREFDDRITELEDRVTIVIFKITQKNTRITLLSFSDKVDWGDGSVQDISHSHTYVETGEYTCKFYDAKDFESELFRNNRNVISVIINGNIAHIGRRVFEGCVNLKSVIMENNITDIGLGTFSMCSSLTNIILSDSITSIGAGAFNGCSSLTEINIPDGVTSIGSSAFNGCSSLTEINIPDGVTSIGDGAFDECSSLTSVIFKNPIPITYNSSLPWFKDCLSLTHIYVPYGCKQAYIDKWTADGAEQAILDLIVESDRVAMMSDIQAGASGVESATTEDINNIFKEA